MCRNLWRYYYRNFVRPPMYGTRFSEWLLTPNYTIRLSKLTNRPQFSTVYTLRDHRNDVIKCSKFKCNLELQTSSFTAKFWTFYGVISVIYTSVDHGKLWSILSFYNNIFLRKTKNNATATAWHVTSFPWSILS